MAKSEESTSVTDVSAMFERASADPDALSAVSRYVRTGRRWDVSHKDLIGDVIVILRVREIQTRYGSARLCDIEHQGVKKTALMGGQVLRDQLDELGVNLPVLAVIRKPARSYGFFDPTPDELAEYKEKYLGKK